MELAQPLDLFLEGGSVHGEVDERSEAGSHSQCVRTELDAVKVVPAVRREQGLRLGVLGKESEKKLI